MTFCRGMYAICKADCVYKVNGRCAKNYICVGKRGECISKEIIVNEKKEVKKNGKLHRSKHKG